MTLVLRIFNNSDQALCFFFMITSPVMAIPTISAVRPASGTLLTGVVVT